jgi:hypothetical protein
VITASKLMFRANKRNWCVIGQRSSFAPLRLFLLRNRRASSNTGMPLRTFTRTSAGGRG